jgi:PKD repeat protein
MIAYHMYWPSNQDPFYQYNVDENLEAQDYYGVGSVPTILFDGPPDYGHNGASTYSYYKGFIDSELANLSPMTITLDGFVYGSTGNVTAEIEVTDALPVGNLKVRFGVVEDNRYTDPTHPHSNGEMRHRYVMRNMLAEETLPALGVGATYTVSREFPMNGTYDPESVSIVVFVQNDHPGFGDDKEVLQAAYYDFIPDDVLVVDDDEGPHPHGSEDTYHELLTYMGYSFDGWAMDERGSPTESDLAPYGSVIWLTGSTNTTLTTADQTAISGYLDNGKGSLFLTGENVGADIGSSPFYSDYLYSLYITNDTGEIQVDGVEFDPISDAYYGSPLPILDDSPSWIIPMAPATSIFKYSSSMNDAGLRVQHDNDSRVVYLAFQYFEGSDSFNDMEGVLYKILNWMEVTIDDIILRDAPGESGNALSSITLDVGQDITVWAAAYNNTNGFLGNYDTTTWAEDSLGSIITITSPGPSTLIQSAGNVSGSVTLTARCFTYLNTTTVTIIPPGIDDIIFRDAPGDSGNILTDITLDVGQNITVWAASYNNTNGFLGNYDTTTWEEDSLGSIITVTSLGPSTLVQADIVGGSVTLTVHCFIYLNTTTVTINPPGVDYIEIRDAPNGTGSIVSTVELNVGMDVTLWAACYNVTAGYLEDVPATIWSEDSGGTLVTLTSLGLSSTITALMTGGVCNVTADVNGILSTVTITINDANPDFIMIRDAAGGSGSVKDGHSLDVGESIELWASAYNHTSGWIFDVPTTLWTEDSGGSIVTLSQPSGASTEVQAGMDGGSSVVKANYTGLENTTTINVNAPTEDFIQIRDDSGNQGNIVENPVYEVGTVFYYWGAAYNNTAGYLYDVPSSAAWSSDNLDVLQVALMGTNTMGLVSDTESGIANVTLEVVDWKLFNSTTITVLTPAIDEMYIIDGANGEGEVVVTRQYEVGENDTYYAASYNETAGYIGDIIVTWSSDNENAGTVPASGSSAFFEAVGIGECTVSFEYMSFEIYTGTITIIDSIPPVADIGSDFTIDEDTVASFDATASYDNSEIMYFNWSFDDGTVLHGSDTAPSHTYPDPGIYNVALIVTDSGGNTDTAEITVTVRDITSPTAVIILQDTVEEDAVLRINGSDSTDNGDIVSYKWEFGDGTSTNGTIANVRYAYDDRGTYTVNLTVTDGAGNTDSTSTTIVVIDVTPPAKPSGLEIAQIATGGTLIVSWEPVSDSDLAYYELFYSVNGGDFSKLGDINSGTTEYTHENLDNGVPYQYYVVAVDFAGNPSPDSSIVTGIPDTDTDGDGSFDLVDTDDDDDGLSDIKEAQVGSDPLNSDSDEDTYIDGEDDFPVNPKEWKDSDNDGYGDANEDAFPRDPDEWVDTDGDGTGDNSDFLPSLNNILFFIIVIAVIAAVLVVALMARKRGGDKVEFTEFSAPPAVPVPPPAAAVPPPPWMMTQKVKSEEPPESKELPPPPVKKDAEVAKEEPAPPEAPAPAGGEEVPKIAEPEAELVPVPAPEAKPRPPRAPSAKAKPRPPRAPKKAKPKEVEK